MKNYRTQWSRFIRIIIITPDETSLSLCPIIVMRSYVAAVEEVSKRQQCGEDVAQSFVLLQLLHTLLQILQGFCHFLPTARRWLLSTGVHKHMFRGARLTQVAGRCTPPPSTHHLHRSEVIRGCLKVAASVIHQMCSQLHEAVVCARQVTHVCPRVCVCVCVCMPSIKAPITRPSRRVQLGTPFCQVERERRKVLPAESRKVYGTATLNSRMHPLPERDAALLRVCILSWCYDITMLMFCGCCCYQNTGKGKAHRCFAHWPRPGQHISFYAKAAVALTSTQSCSSRFHIVPHA